MKIVLIVLSVIILSFKVCASDSYIKIETKVENEVKSDKSWYKIKSNNNELLAFKTKVKNKGVGSSTYKNLLSQYVGKTKILPSNMDLLGSGRSPFNHNGNLVIDVSPQIRREAIANYDGTLTNYATGEYFLYVDGKLIKHEDLSITHPDQFGPGKPVWFNIGHIPYLRVNSINSIIAIAFVYKSNNGSPDKNILVSIRNPRRS